MSVALESDVSQAVSNTTSGNFELARLEKWLPALLSTIAGMVDVIGFLTLGLFTAHITGNLVIIAVLLVRGGAPNPALIIALPVFAIDVAAVWLIARALGRRGPTLARPLLLIQFLLLTCVLVLSVSFDPDRHGLMAIVVAVIAVAAMACQFSLLRLAVPGAPSTAVMTGNLTNAVLSLLDTLSPGGHLTDGSGERLKKTLKVVIGFCAGCIAGAVAVSFLGAWAWSIPVAFAGAAIPLATRSTK